MSSKTSVPSLPVPNEPLKIALIGAGFRSQRIYQPLWQSLLPWCQVVAVCDPVAENCEKMAQALGVRGYGNIRNLVNDRPMEAAVIVTPIPSHHSISVYLSTHGIHNHVETTWASMLCQAQEMIRVAQQQNVITGVAENFFRMPIDRFAQTVRDSKYLGDIARIVCYGDHAGFHNNCRWLVFAGCSPQWVQAIEHAMEHPPFYETPERYLQREMFSTRFFQFSSGLMIQDTEVGHIKGLLGRCPRPGYTEWHGQRGALVHYSRVDSGWDHHPKTQLRRCSDGMFASAQEATGNRNGGGIADELTEVDYQTIDGVWSAMVAQTPTETIEYISPLQPYIRFKEVNNSDFYGVAVMDHIIDFVLAVRGLRDREFTAEDALMSEMMELGAKESALQQGRRIKLPITGELETDSIIRQEQKEVFGVDPMDVQAMLDLSFPKP